MPKVSRTPRPKDSRMPDPVPSASSKPKKEDMVDSSGEPKLKLASDVPESYKKQVTEQAKKEGVPVKVEEQGKAEGK